MQTKNAFSNAHFPKFLALWFVASLLMGFITLMMGNSAAVPAQAAVCTHTIGNWSSITDLPEPKIEAQMAVYQGKIYILGGFINTNWAPTNRFDVYDPATNNYTRLKGYPPGAITHGGMVVDETRGNIWVAGGFRPHNPTNQVWRYNIAENEWYQEVSLPESRASAMLVKQGDKIHFIGGIKANRSTHTGDHWALNLSSPTAWQTLAPLPRPRNHGSVAVMGNEIHYIAGMFGHNGWTDDNGNGMGPTTDVRIIDIYDVPTNTWREAPDLSEDRSHSEPGTIYSHDRVLLVGGRDNVNPPSGWQAVKSILEYNPNTGQSHAIKDLPQFRLAPIAAIVGGHIYAMGGSNTSAAAWRAPISYNCGADTPGVTVEVTAATPEVAPGETASFSVKVTNTGKMRLNVDVASNVANCQKAFQGIRAGNEEVYTCTAPNLTQNLTNNITITAKTPYGALMNANASASVVIVDTPPTEPPTDEPTETPTDEPTETPTDEPTETPSGTPNGTPTDEPTETPSGTPNGTPTDEPTETPSGTPTDEPTETPTDTPIIIITPESTPEPTNEGSDDNTATSPPPTDTDAPTDTPGDGVQGPVRPVLNWQPFMAGDGSVIPADWYHIVIRDAAGNIVLDIWVPAANLCTANGCAFTPDANTLPFGLLNGNYTWTVGAYDENSQIPADWSVGGQITVDAPLPVPRVETAIGRPVLILPNDPEILWFHIWIGTPQWETLHLNWHEKQALDCNAQTCTLIPEVHPTNGAYVVYMQTWNTTGFNNDDPNFWQGPLNFNLSFPAPGLVPGMMADTSSNPPRFTWTNQPGVTWYHIWIGTPGPDYVTYHSGWHNTLELGCAGQSTCTLNGPQNMLTGDYIWYMQAWGPGGLTTGGVGDGWVEGPPFQKD